MSTTRVLADRYELRGTLGAGGMATVYRGFDRLLEIDVAVKILAPNLAGHSSLRERFLNEARTMAKLRHDHIVQVLNVGVDGAEPFLVMEYLTGGDLHGRVEQGGPIPPKEAARYIDEVLAGLEVAHRHGVVHRDIKPHNVLLDAHGRARLSDFGIARAEAVHHLTRTGAVMGTMAFMAPEQRSNAKGVDARSDLYAVGATFYVLLTGREPFDLYVTEERQSLFEGLPEALSTFISRATRYRPDERFSSASEMRAALSELRPTLPDVLEVNDPQSAATRYGPLGARPPSADPPQVAPGLADADTRTWSGEPETPAFGPRANSTFGGVDTLADPPRANPSVEAPSVAVAAAASRGWLYGVAVAAAVGLVVVTGIVAAVSGADVSSAEVDGGDLAEGTTASVEPEFGPGPPPTVDVAQRIDVGSPPSPSKAPDVLPFDPASLPMLPPAPPAPAVQARPPRPTASTTATERAPTPPSPGPAPVAAVPVRLATMPRSMISVGGGSEHGTPWVTTLNPGRTTLTVRREDGETRTWTIEVAPDGSQQQPFCFDWATNGPC